MSFFVNASQEEAFRLVMNYFTGRHMKIPTSTSPSYIEVDFGSLFSLSLDNAKGKVKLNVVKSNGGAHVNLNFDFSLDYLAILTVTIIGLLMIYIYYTILEIPVAYTLLIMLLIVAFAGGIVQYSVRLTRRKIIDAFNMFVQSFDSKRPD